MNFIYLLVIALSALVIALLILVILSVRRSRELLRFKDDALKRMNELHEELKSIDKSKTEFMNIAAHELKTPLVPIIGFLHLIDEKELDAKNKESINIIKRNVEKLQEIIEDILDISRLESRIMNLNIEKIDLKELIESSVERAKPQAKEKGIKINTSLSKAPSKIHADDIRITQVLDNLLKNTIELTEKGDVRIKAEQKDEKVQVKVKSDNVKTDREAITGLFSDSLQTKSQMSFGKNSPGLDLLLCKEIIETHDGEIWVESEQKNKITFNFTIPIENKQKQESRGNK